MIFDIDHPVSAILFGTPVVSNCTSYYKTIEELFAAEIVLSVNTDEITIDHARQMLPFCGVVHPALTPMSKPYHLSANSIFRVGGAVYVAYSDVSVHSERLMGSCGRGFYFHEDAFRRCMLLTGSGVESPEVVSNTETPTSTTPESDEYRVALYSWIAANAPGGWIDELRKERDELMSTAKQTLDALRTLHAIASEEVYATPSLVNACRTAGMLIVATEKAGVM